MTKTNRKVGGQPGNNNAFKPPEFKQKRQLFKWALEQAVEDQILPKLQKIIEHAVEKKNMSTIIWAYEAVMGKNIGAVNLQGDNNNVQINISNEELLKLVEDVRESATINE